jgi:starch phosphorylase
MRQNYDPNKIIAEDKDIRRVMELLESGRFNTHEPGIFDVLIAGLRNAHDQWLTIADLRSYIDAQQDVNDQYKDQQAWNRMSIINTASSGWFSSDRTISQYAADIWDVRSVRPS